jgi:hypothetical protein
MILSKGRPALKIKQWNNSEKKPQHLGQPDLAPAGLRDSFFFFQLVDLSVNS